MEVRMGTLSLLLPCMCPNASGTPQKGQGAIAILWLRETDSYTCFDFGFHIIVCPRGEELENLVKILQ